MVSGGEVTNSEHDTEPNGSEMTDLVTATQSSGTVEAVSIIDRALSEMLQRELISTNEVADLLLDLRSLLVAESKVLVES